MKRCFLIALGLFVGGSILNNIKTQYSTLKEAEKQNLITEMGVAKLKQENQVLKQKIEYSTSSAFVEEETRDKLAMGKENEVWLKLRPDERLDLYPKINETKEVSKIRQWINLFTQ